MEVNNTENLRVGTRNSRLSLMQTAFALQKMRQYLPAVDFVDVPYSSPGDRDRRIDLRRTDGDFFTKDLDDALRRKEVDMALHSAKDLPDPLPEELGMVWLPWYEERRDVLVLRRGMSLNELPEAPVVGVSSERRGNYCKKRFPQGIIKPVRGNVEQRIAKLDAGEYDVLIVAAAGLIRSGLKDRITSTIPLSALEPPAGQGRLAITFRADDERLLRLRSLFVKSIIFAGGGPGNERLCTLAAREALENCDVCLYDALVSSRLLAWLPDGAQVVPVGKRAGKHGCSQKEICELLVEYACQGKRVVRLKGGDPGIFGRLAEEIEAVENSSLPYRVIPGVTSLSAATTGTGLLLTRRNVAAGFAAMTAAGAEGRGVSVKGQDRAALPVAFFMGKKKLDDITKQLKEDGTDPETPCAVVFDSGGEKQRTITGSLADITRRVKAENNDAPALILVGKIANPDFLYRNHGALAGRKILLTCSEALMPKAAGCVRDFGGVPVCRPAIRFERTENVDQLGSAIDLHDWILVTSPMAVDILMDTMRAQDIDMRRLPKIIVSGPGTAEKLNHYNIGAAGVPDSEYGGESVHSLTQKLVSGGERVLRVRSDQAGDRLVTVLKNDGVETTDFVLYKTITRKYEEQPDFDGVVFTSGSTVRGFAANWGVSALQDLPIAVMGQPTAKVLRSYGLKPTIQPPQAAVDSLIMALAGWFIGSDKKLWQLTNS